jgi:sulfate transport system substrate-binding protein
MRATVRSTGTESLAGRLRRLRLVPALVLLAFGASQARIVEILNVSFDPTRRLYQEIGREFAAQWLSRTGETVKILQSHGGSGKQARSVIDGVEADVVTLALGYDIDAIARKGKLLDPGWQSRLPDHSTPFRSTVVFLVRRGNPKGIRDWADLVKPGVAVITPNPKTSGGARWNHLAAWAWALRRPGGSEASALAYMKAFYAHVPILDAGARGATMTFVQRGMGDVLVTWESEALTAREKLGRDKFEVVYPSVSILAEPPVAVVDKVVKRRHTEAVSRAYLEYLYTSAAQEIAARYGFRPVDTLVARRHAAQFPAMRLVELTELGKDWQEIQRKHFDDGGVFDRVSATR